MVGLGGSIALSRHVMRTDLYERANAAIDLPRECPVADRRCVESTDHGSIEPRNHKQVSSARRSERVLLALSVSVLG